MTETALFSERIAFYYTLAFQRRVLDPLASLFANVLVTNNSTSLKNWNPSVIVLADYALKEFREYCDRNDCILVGMRHGAINKYSTAEEDFSYADYLVGSEWERRYLESAGIRPRKQFIVTGNPWVDGVFGLPAHDLNNSAPTILVAPTYNPGISLASLGAGAVVQTIRRSYPGSRIIIKPHPAIIESSFHHVVHHQSLFRQWMMEWEQESTLDNRISLVEDSSASISDFFAEADILISDLSSLVFEFMVLKRPIVLFRGPGFEDFFREDPDAVVTQWRDVGSEFTSLEGLGDVLGPVFESHTSFCKDAQRKHTDELYGKHQDGRSTRRVSEAIKRIVSERQHAGEAGHLVELGIQEFQSGRCDRAESHFKEAIRLNPTERQGRHQYAMVLAHERRPDEAIRQLEEIIRLDPVSCVAHNDLGVLCLQEGAHQKALAHFKRAVAANGQYLVARKNLADLQIVLGDFDGAASMYHTLLTQEPDDVDALFVLARLSIEAGRFDGARHFLLRILDVDPDHAEARTTLDTFKQWEKDGLIPPLSDHDAFPISGNGERRPRLLDMLLRDKPRFHVDGNGEPATWNTSISLLRFLDSHLQPGMHTLETGSGYSTVMFIGKGCVHTALTPFQDEGKRIREYCLKKGIVTEKFTFVAKDSADYLPGITGKNLDVLFVDGAHRFPFPIVDWYHGTNLLKEGGFFILDDTNIISCFILMKFLEQDTHWEKVLKEGNFAVFKKLDGHDYPDDWPAQVFSAKMIDGEKTLLHLFYP